MADSDIPAFLRAQGESDGGGRQSRSQYNSSDGFPWGWAVVVALFLLVVGGAVWGLRGKEAAGPTPLPTQSPASTPRIKFATPRPTPEANREDYPITVLNGSGRAGEAGEVQELLEGEGFVVEETDNADSFDSTETVIRTDGEVPDTIINALREVLSEEFTDVTSTIEEDQEEAVIIITGGDRKGATPVPATPVPADEEATDSADSE